MLSEDFAGAEDTARFAEDLVQESRPALSSDEENAVSSLPSGSALLIVKSGAGQGSRFLLDADVTLAGRHPDADILLDDVTVSRKHAEFTRQAKRFAVADLGSMNGLYVNGAQVDSTALSNGDEIQIGKYRMTFFAAESDR